MRLWAVRWGLYGVWVAWCEGGVFALCVIGMSASVVLLCV